MRKLILLISAAAALVVALPASSATTTQATITKTGFVPQAITIAPNDAVTWTNVDKVNHQIVNLNGKAISPVIKPNGRFTKTFFSAGVYTYMDSNDDTMRTTVTVRPAAPESVTMSASASEVTFGRSFTLSGTVSSKKAGETVAIFAQRFDESSYSQIDTVTSGDGGAWSDQVSPDVKTSYQAHWHNAASGAAAVGVHPLVTIRVLAGVTRFSTRVVGERSFVGRIVRFQRRTSLGTWRTLKNVRLGGGSIAVFRARVPHGTSALRMYFSPSQAGSGYLAGISRTLIYHRA